MLRCPTIGAIRRSPAIGVLRRIRDGGEEFSPGQIAGLSAWFDPQVGVYSDGGVTPAVATDPLQEWHDRQGNYVASASGTMRPTMLANAIGSITCPDFDGSNDRMALNVALPCIQGEAYTNFSVYNRVNASHKMIGLASSHASRAPYPSLQWTDGKSYHIGGGASGRNTSVASSRTGKVIITTRFTGTSHTVFYDGVDMTEAVIGNFPYGTTLNWIGVRGAPNDFTNGSIGDILHYDSALPTEDIQNVENYLIAKYEFSGFDEGFDDGFGF